MTRGVTPRKEQAMTDEHTDIDPLVAIIRSEMDQLKQLSETAKDSRAPVTLDQQSVGRLSRMDAMQQQSMELRLRGLSARQTL